MAEAGVRLVKAFGPANIPRLQEIALDWRVLVFAFITSLFCGILFSLAPAAYACCLRTWRDRIA